MDRDKLIDILNEYFCIKTDTYTYELTRVKSAFGVGTMTFEDFQEWTEVNTADLADYIISNL